MWLAYIIMAFVAYLVAMIYFRPGWKDGLVTFGIVLLCVTFYIFLTSGMDVSGREMFAAHKLLEAYDDLNGYTSDISKFQKKQVTYGEITGDGVKELKKIAAQYGGLSEFVDMGCGVGRSLVLARISGFKKCTGIELVEDRFKQAQSLMSKLPREWQSNTTVHHGDALQYDMKSHASTLVYASNLMWSREMNKRLFAKMAKECPKGTVVVVSNVDGFKAGHGIVMIGSTIVPMSWDLTSVVYILLI